MEIIRPTILEINLNNLIKNYNYFCKFVSKNTKVLSVIKANAYGLGSEQVVKVLEKCGCDYFGVATIEEGIFIRRCGIKSNILILGSIFPFSSFEYIVKYNLVPTISSFDIAEKFSIFCKDKNINYKIHIKIDTGMNRIGININNAFSTICKIFELKNLNIEGIFSHLARTIDKKFTFYQIKLFKNLKENIENKFFGKVKYFHLASTYGTLNYKESHFDMVRIGIGFYEKINKELNSIMKLKTKIVFLKKVLAGSPISYDGIFIAPEDMIIATLPIGYADGYRRELSNQAIGICKNKIIRQVGRICMDMCMFDVSEVKDIDIGDEVILIGNDNKNEILVNNLAEKCNTISYEILTGFSQRISRIYKN